MEDEIWVDIKDYEGLYQVSNKGRVKSLKRIARHSSGGNKILKEKLLKQTVNKRGYVVVTLYKDGVSKQFKIHTLVAVAFIPNVENKPYIDHINTIKIDNRVENLRWVTEKENSNNELTLKHIKEGCKNNGRNTPHKYGVEHPNSRQIVKLSLDLDLIKIWGSCGEAERLEGFNHGHISKCCKGKAKTHKGYKWMYYEDYIKLKGEI